MDSTLSQILEALVTSTQRVRELERENADLRRDIEQMLAERLRSVTDNQDRPIDTVRGGG